MKGAKGVAHGLGVIFFSTLPDKGPKFGTNEAVIIKINNRIGSILELSCFWQNFNMSISHKGFSP